MELKNQEIPATVEPLARPTDEEIREAAQSAISKYRDDERNELDTATAGFIKGFTAGAGFALSRLNPQPAAVAPTMSKEEIEELVRIERIEVTLGRQLNDYSYGRLEDLRAKLAKMGSGS